MQIHDVFKFQEFSDNLMKYSDFFVLKGPKAARRDLWFYIFRLTFCGHFVSTSFSRTLLGTS